MNPKNVIAVEQADGNFFLDCEKIDGFKLDYTNNSALVFLNGQPIKIYFDSLSDMINFQNALLEE